MKRYCCSSDAETLLPFFVYLLSVTVAEVRLEYVRDEETFIPLDRCFTEETSSKLVTFEN